jgi:hypothetical protein
MDKKEFGLRTVALARTLSDVMNSDDGDHDFFVQMAALSYVFGAAVAVLEPENYDLAFKKHRDTAEAVAMVAIQLECEGNA